MSRPVGGVEVRELLQEGPEGGLLGEPIPLVDLRGVRGVERDPEEDEPPVLVTPLAICSARWSQLSALWTRRARFG